ncbi:MAG: hypothetical protein IT479_05035 [Xanthomonadales bacterium]|nr:hypothetical protein [Xanthomonadales bacterium]MCC6592621.1 hypothetical protein [Xanthomonadales bacterium]MCE7931961.1 hypothetical protein [Xanthomonadales bacterium PRO6]
MSEEGPPLEQLTRRLIDTPTPFLAEPRIAGHGSVHVPALVGDVLAAHGISADLKLIERFAGRDRAKERNPRTLTQILCWLLMDESLLGRIGPGELLRLLYDEANALAEKTAAKAWIDDDERREELARMALRGAGLRPAGESENVAEDRFLAVSSRERARLAAATRAAEERARQIREALAKKAAEESADKWSRE